jgi:hypothetical protein
MEEPTEKMKAFYLAEYGALRSEIILSLTEVRALERYIAVACAAIWSWVATHPESPTILLCLPIVLTLLGGLRASAYWKEFGNVHDYIKKIENLLGSRDCEVTDESAVLPTGWEHCTKARQDLITASAVLFWIGLLLAGGLAFLLPTGKDVSKSAVTMTCSPNRQMNCTGSYGFRRRRR